MRPNRTDIAVRARTLVERNRRPRGPVPRRPSGPPSVERVLRELRTGTVMRGDARDG